MERKIRLRQLIVPFGPGSIYVDSEGIPLIIHGLDLWFKRINQIYERKGNSNNIFLEDYIIKEKRLEKILKVKKLMTPPDFIKYSPGERSIPNHSLAIPVSRFPTWYRNINTRELRQFNSLDRKIDKGWVAVRFICVCENGHLTDFPWKKWIKCECPDSSGLRLSDSGGSNLSSIRIWCEKCPPESEGHKGRSLAGTSAFLDDEKTETLLKKEGIKCPGETPWLDNKEQHDDCDAPLVVALINQSNLYFPKIVTSIKIPDSCSQDNSNKKMEDFELFEKSDNAKEILKSNMNNDVKMNLLMMLFEKNKTNISKEFIEKLIEEPDLIEKKKNAINHGLIKEPEITAFRREEYKILLGNNGELGTDGDIVVRRMEIHEKLSMLFSRINIAEKLTETMAFAGFDRLTYRGFSSKDMPDMAIRKLFGKRPVVPWLPAIETHGEGIFLEFNQDHFLSWFKKHEDWLGNRIQEEFLEKLSKVNIIFAPKRHLSLFWATKLMVAHSLAHVLIRQITYESGYGSASLKERLYISDDRSEPMMGILIYTSSGDSEGSLGGLARLGNQDRFLPLLKKALIKASWCSSDPLCSENQILEMANLAACHACLLLPETSCETFNQGLDRVLIAGPLEHREKGYFHELLNI